MPAHSRRGIPTHATALVGNVDAFATANAPVTQAIAADLESLMLGPGPFWLLVDAGQLSGIDVNQDPPFSFHLTNNYRRRAIEKGGVANFTTGVLGVDVTTGYSFHYTCPQCQAGVISTASGTVNTPGKDICSSIDAVAYVQGGDLTEETLDEVDVEVFQGSACAGMSLGAAHAYVDVTVPSDAGVPADLAAPAPDLAMTPLVAIQPSQPPPIMPSGSVGLAARVTGVANLAGYSFQWTNTGGGGALAGITNGACTTVSQVTYDASSTVKMTVTDKITLTAWSNPTCQGAPLAPPATGCVTVAPDSTCAGGAVTQISGTVSDNGPSSVGARCAGASVTASYGGNTWSATTDGCGQFLLNDVPAGIDFVLNVSAAGATTSVTVAHVAPCVRTAVPIHVAGASCCTAAGAPSCACNCCGKCTMVTGTTGICK